MILCSARMCDAESDLRFQEFNRSSSLTRRLKGDDTNRPMQIPYATFDNKPDRYE
jgi:hypothetical protein